MRTIPVKSRRRQRGFSLIEALAAATLLAVTMMAFNMTSITLARGTKIADSASVATALAQEQLELLRSLPRGHAMHNPGNYQDPGNPLTADGQSGGIYARTWRVSANNVPDFGLRSVVVRVSWNGPDPHSLELAGFVRCSKVPC